MCLYIAGRFFELLKERSFPLNQIRVLCRFNGARGPKLHKIGNRVRPGKRRQIDHGCLLKSIELTVFNLWRLQIIDLELRSFAKRVATAHCTQAHKHTFIHCHRIPEKDFRSQSNIYKYFVLHKCIHIYIKKDIRGRYM